MGVFESKGRTPIGLEPDGSLFRNSEKGCCSFKSRKDIDHDEDDET